MPTPNEERAHLDWQISELALEVRAREEEKRLAPLLYGGLGKHLTPEQLAALDRKVIEIQQRDRQIERAMHHRPMHDIRVKG